MKLTIRGKLLIGFTVILTSLILQLFFIVNKFSESNNRLNHIVTTTSKRTELSRELMVAVLQAARHEKNIILEKDSPRKYFSRDRLQEALADIDKKSSELEPLLEEDGSEILENVNQVWDSYQHDLSQIVTFAMKGEHDKAFNLSIGKGFTVRDSVINQLSRLIDISTKKMEVQKRQNEENYQSGVRLIIGLTLAIIILALLIAYWIVNTITKRISLMAVEADNIASREFSKDDMEYRSTDELKPIFDSLVNIKRSFLEVTERANSVAKGDYGVEFVPRSERDVLGNALKQMTHSLRETTAINAKHNWLSTGQNLLNEKLMGDQNIEVLSTNVISFLCNYLNANIGSVYLLDEKDQSLTIQGQYAFASNDEVKKRFYMNQGLIGQAAYEQKQICLSGIDEGRLRMTSSILDKKISHVVVTPFLFEGHTLGVVEIGKFTEFTDTEKEFMANSMESIGISIHSSLDRKQIQELLRETQMQSEELQSQQEELKQMNEELEEQSQNLLQQQEELRMTNEELEAQTQSLIVKNKEVEEAKYDIEQKTKQLEISSKYKSEFLSNMSHELRTPLNSLLILSKDLSENRKANLTEDQVESAKIIYKSGHDLLILINEVLDLSKIEAGKMSLNIDKIEIRTFIEEQVRAFKFQASEKGLDLIVKYDNELPECMVSDSQRVSQILKNLLSNAIKFTDKGSVTLHVSKVENDKIRLSVSDTGIGVDKEKHDAIFEAFQQADGGTSRKYGGTGLGLSISKELAKLLGGEIKVKSKLNEGSDFSVILPIELEDESEKNIFVTEVKPHADAMIRQTRKYLNYPTLNDDRNAISKEDKVILVIEDDLKFADILLKQANEKGFKCLSAATGEDGLELAAKYNPCAIILDIDLPGMDGNQVLSELKANPAIRHIPVHIISVNERSMNSIKNGAIEYLMKPIEKNDLDEAFRRIESFVNRKMKNLLIIEDDANSRLAVKKLIGNGDVKCFEAGTAREAIALFKEHHFDCIVLDLGLPDMDGFTLIHTFEKLTGHKVPPVIIYTGRELTKEENYELQKCSESIIIKGVKSEERLLDETALFLHRTIRNLPDAKQKIINNLYDKEIVFQSKRILLVDDDMRNVFALTRILQDRGMEVIRAEHGKAALKELEKDSKVDLVLMDIMMPEMDGYEAMRQIRKMEQFKSLPIIALTAKAMKEDKKKCLAAGANEYITKPIDTDRLLSLMRVWLSR
ncbi:MAG: baeS7 [Bacteroidota bacterium]|jgi:CheY-like chemotaxis protein|nr:baeS7 [Bacteroidota bacterium]